MNYVLISAAFVAGVCICYIFLKLKTASQIQNSMAELATLSERLKNAELKNDELKAFSEEIRKKTELMDSALKAEIHARSAAEQNAAQVPAFEQKIASYEKSINDLSVRNAELSTILSKERLDTDEKLKLLDEGRQKFSETFKNLANEIFDEKSKKFTETNKISLEVLLNPLGLKLKEFEKKVEETHEKSVRDRSSIIEKISQLQELNRKLSEDAVNLTRALKGESKVQGNWGEMVLERILEASGLQKDIEYKVQESYTNEENKRFFPDVVIHLPEKKHIIIDSKVSLTAYEKYSSAETDEERNTALRAHILSIRKHLLELSDKSYQKLSQLTTPDFVLMFIPLEPALSIALQTDSELFMDGMSKNVVIVTPSTLLATLRTVAHIWKQEKQNRNAVEIARQGGLLYDKFCNFVKDLEDVGKKLEMAQKSHTEAMSKLKTGRGNLIKRAEDIRKLGAREKERLSDDLLLESDSEDFSDDNEQNS